MELSNLSPGVLAALIALAVVQFGLQGFALFRWAKTVSAAQPIIRGSERWVWLAVIIFGQLLGALGFLITVRGLSTPSARNHEKSGPTSTTTATQRNQELVARLWPAPLPASDAPPLVVHNLSKSFGPNHVLRQVNFSLTPGSITGLLGPNGAGKSTLMKILLGLAHADSGNAQIFGHAVPNPRSRRKIGFVPDVPDFHRWLTAREYLEEAGALLGLEPAEARGRADRLLSAVDLRSTVKLSGFSRGMRQRLGIAQAFIDAPKLMILDEPTTALDPLGRAAFLDLLNQVRGRTTVLFSSHQLSDVERVADHILLIRHGEIVPAPRMSNRIRLRVTARTPAVIATLRTEPWVTAVENSDHISITATDPHLAAERIPEICLANGAGIIELVEHKPTLEDMFLEIFTAEADHAA